MNPPIAKRNAIMHFAHEPDARVVNSLVALALNPQHDENEQSIAAEAVLQALGEAEYVERFAHAYHTLTGEQRRLALCALADWAPETARLVLVDALEAAEPDIVSLAIEGLGCIEDPILGDDIRPFIDHDDNEIRRAAHEAMSRLDTEYAAARAIADLGSDDCERRFNAVMQLIDNPSKSAVGPLFARLKDLTESPSVRSKSVEALGATRDPRAFDTVLAALNDSSKSVRSTAARFLGNFETSKIHAPSSHWGNTYMPASMTRLPTAWQPLR
jgi:HEAT repeat protein